MSKVDDILDYLQRLLFFPFAGLALYFYFKYLFTILGNLFILMIILLAAAILLHCITNRISKIGDKYYYLSFITWRMLDPYSIKKATAISNRLALIRYKNGWFPFGFYQVGILRDRAILAELVRNVNKGSKKASLKAEKEQIGNENIIKNSVKAFFFQIRHHCHGNIYVNMDLFNAI
ncbi:MAG TPA: hypothetical protein VM658_02415 [bacterium]|nr:hypothetical protein [bacterium]